MNASKLSLFPVFLLIFSACQPQQGETTQWQLLFNGTDLSGWDTYLGAPHEDIEISDSLQLAEGESLGQNQDPKQVFSVVEVDGAPAIRISGEIWGGISTTQAFENYHLLLEFKWGARRWPPRDSAKRDSGVLYHAVGPHGADGGFWMRSHEMQVQESDCGDYWGVAGAIADIPARMTADSQYVYDPKAELHTFSPYNETGRHCIKHPDAEKPSGEWNILELICYGDTSLHIVNGVRNMVLYNLKQSDGTEATPLTRGKIQIQSEGAEVFYRNLRIRPVEGIPASYLSK